MKIMVVLSRIPYPLSKGDKLRAFNQIKSLSQHHDIYLFCLSHTKPDPKAIAYLSNYCKEIHCEQIYPIALIFNIFLAFVKGLPLQIGYFFSKKAKKQYIRFEQQVQPNRLFCQFIRTVEYVRNSNIFKVLDYQDALSKNVERRSAKAPFYMQTLLRMEYKRLLKYEHSVFDLFNEKVIISEADKECILHLQKDKIHVIPNGVDTGYFQPFQESNKIYDIVFTGNMSYPPNVNAALFLLKKIMPCIWKERPDTKVLIAGTNPALSILSQKSEKVTISGWVDDIRQCYSQAKIFIAPMQIGTGLQNKLLEAMAMQIPCITSELANKALKAAHGKEILIAETPEEYANAVLKLLNDNSFLEEIALNGYNYTRQTFSWETFNASLESVICQS